MFRVVWFLVLTACAANNLKSSSTHIDLANEALERGDYDTASKEYANAKSRAEGAGADWVRAEAERGEARIEIAGMRKALPERRAALSDMARAVSNIHEDRIRLRTLGGDAVLDAELVAIMGEHAQRWITDSEARARSGDIYAGATSARGLLAIPDLPADVVSRARALQQGAADASTRRAAQAGDAHPLARRLHLAIAASYVGGTAPGSTTLTAPYDRGVEVAVTAPSGCSLTELDRELRLPGATRRASVAVTVTACTASETSTDSKETATWTEEVLDHYDTVMVTSQKCEQQCGSVLSGGESCVSNYNTNPPSLLCTKNTITKCFEVCTPIQVPTQEPRYRTENREAQRTVTTRRSVATVAGTWVVRRDGQEWTGEIAQSPSSQLVSAPAVGGAPARSTGSFTAPSSLIDGARSTVKWDIEKRLAAVFATDVANAVAAAAKAAGNIDDEEELWTRAVVLGGTDAGPLTARYGLPVERVVAMMRDTTFAALPAPSALQPPRVFDVGERKDTDTYTRNDRDEFAKNVPPFFGGKYWLQLDVARLSLPVRMGVGTEGDSALLVGARAATRVLGRQAPTSFGLRLVDELSMAVALGGRTGGPEAPDDATAGFAGTFSGHYALGLGYRAPGRGGLFAGARGTYALFKVGPSQGSYQSLPVFVRGELTLKSMTISAELLGATLQGAAQRGLTFHISSKRKWEDSRVKYFQVRIEQTVVNPSVLDLNTSNGDRSLGEQDLTSVNLLYGVGY